MVGSIWRYSHFLIAAISAIFILIASISGAILAFEPIAQSSQNFKVANFEEITLDQTITALKPHYDEVLDIKVTADSFVQASVFTKEGNSETIYVNPTTGEKIGEVLPQSPFFSFVTNFHRSLFLKSVGRGFVGIISFLLCLIAITGVFLLAERQGGFKKWFAKVQEKDWGQRYHVVLSRWFLLPIIILAATGVYLSAEKFSLLPNDDLSHTESQQIQDFQQLKLAEVRSLVFPFSPDEEDYYELSLNDREQFIHQYSGKVISEAKYPFVTIASRLSMTLHTGQGSVVWSLVLLISSLSLLFFIYSGLAMSIKRLSKKKTVVKNDDKDTCEYVLLIGSETGSTNAFASSFQRALKAVGKKVYLTSLNEYTTYKSAKQLIVFTATYGDGDAPSNARKFEKLFQQIAPENTLKYSVVGFGSTSYPNYCQFAIEVEELFKNHTSFEAITPLAKINNQSTSAFESWVDDWKTANNMQLKVDVSSLQPKQKRKRTITVLEKTELNSDATFLLRLKVKRAKFQSGDLLNIIPPESSTIRQYSIAKIGKDILLSIKKHEHGVCSTFLSELKVGDEFKATIQKNEEFHLPTNTEHVFMISNGTGIAPFLGMLDEVNANTKVNFIWGGRTKASYDLYERELEALIDCKNISVNKAFSKEATKTYVQDLISEQGEFVATSLKDGAVLMLCGSVAMQKGVMETLDHICLEYLETSIEYFEKKGQLLSDCY